FNDSTVDVLQDNNLTSFDNDRIYFIDETADINADPGFTFRAHGFTDGNVVKYTVEPKPFADPPVATVLDGLVANALYRIEDSTTSSVRLQAYLEAEVPFNRTGDTDKIILNSGTWSAAGFRSSSGVSQINLGGT